MRKGELIFSFLLAASLAIAQTAGPNSNKPLTFSQDVAPILYKHSRLMSTRPERHERFLQALS
jgi:hypothetical protein